MKTLPFLISSLFILATLGACRPQDEAVAVSGSSAPPPPDASEVIVEAARGDIRVELSAEPDAVAPGQSVALNVENHGRIPVEFGRPIRVERWDGSSWTETAASRETMWTMDLLLTAPGESGPSQRWPFSEDAHPVPGWYRFSKEVSASGDMGNRRVTVRARVLVLEE